MQRLLLALERSEALFELPLKGGALASVQKVWQVAFGGSPWPIVSVGAQGPTGVAVETVSERLVHEAADMPPFPPTACPGDLEDPKVNGVAPEPRARPRVVLASAVDRDQRMAWGNPQVGETALLEAIADPLHDLHEDVPFEASPL